MRGRRELVRKEVVVAKSELEALPKHLRAYRLAPSAEVLAEFDWKRRGPLDWDRIRFTDGKSVVEYEFEGANVMDSFVELLLGDRTKTTLI